MATGRGTIEKWGFPGKNGEITMEKWGISREKYGKMGKSPWKNGDFLMWDEKWDEEWDLDGIEWDLTVFD